MKLVIDESCYQYQKIFSGFGKIISLDGKDINNKIIKNTDILIIRSRTKVDENLLKKSTVKFVGSTVAGIDHVDIDYLKNNNIKFSQAKGCNANAVAEFVISSIINLAAKLNFDYTKKTLGIIGVGNIGKILAHKASLLGIKTILNDPLRKEKENLPNFVSLDKAIESDIVSFHTPLTFNCKYPTYKLLNNNNFHKITDKTILINTARGGIIDEQIWQNTNTLANVIDCWENEPNINQKLQKNAYLATPHIAGHSIDAKFIGNIMIYKELCKFLNVNYDDNVLKLINKRKLTIKKDNLKDSINAIYDFKKDSLAIKDIKNFEKYRKNYPVRYEWHNFNSKVNLPIS
jgi:erythronate-4-phosphate dehydrogenase